MSCLADITTLQIDKDFGEMFPGKADLLLCKWEATIFLKLLKLAALEKNVEGPPQPESAGKLQAMG